jgi:hypothetical protein
MKGEEKMNAEVGKTINNPYYLFKLLMKGDQGSQQ